MLKKPIAISSFASISPLGADPKSIWESYLKPHHFFSKINDEYASGSSKGLKESVKE